MSYCYVEEGCEEIPDHGWAEIVRESPALYSRPGIYHTHRFAILKVLSPHVMRIRMSRRDRLAQFISFMFMQRAKRRHPKWWAVPHLARNPPLTLPDRARQFARIVADTRGITVTRAEVAAWLLRKASREALWAAHGHGGQTIYYEDLDGGVLISDLGIAGFGFAQRGPCMKLPYDKNSVIKNLAEVSTWINEEST